MINGRVKIVIGKAVVAAHMWSEIDNPNSEEFSNYQYLKYFTDSLCIAET